MIPPGINAIVRHDGKWLLFCNPTGTISADCHADVLPALEAVRKAVERGSYAAGFVSYEAAPGLDPAMSNLQMPGYPLVWFGLFNQPEILDPSVLNPPDSLSGMTSWTPSVSAGEYDKAIARIKKYLAAGDTYQVNYSIRFRAAFKNDPLNLFRTLQAAQQGNHGVFLDTGALAICSASPELFFTLENGVLVCRPMKGTAARGLTAEADARNAETLRLSEKNRAENVMIVDMIRNDMGRIAKPGSVKVERMFDVEQYPTVHQMTSTVACKTSASFPEIMKALFPCASVTGAPKIRTMEIINELETSPRGVYTGCAGCLLPGGSATFNVAIRTVAVDKLRGTAEYGAGGGIVWDSDASNEYEECLIKTAVLVTNAPEFDLLETILWERAGGYFLADLHIRRLLDSAGYFGFAADTGAIRNRLAAAEPEMKNEEACKVRLLVARDGGIRLEWEPVSLNEGPWKVAFAPAPANIRSPYLYHKTTYRRVYEEARKSRPGCDDVLLWNDRGEITESCVANIVIEKDGRRITPPVACGLLPGVFRGHLLERGEIEEGILTRQDLKTADRIFLVNSVRKWVPVKLRDA